MTLIIAKNPNGGRYRLAVEDDGSKVSEITINGIAPAWMQQKVQTYNITHPYTPNAIALLKSELIKRGELETVIA